jgi:hypothetical protein
MKFVAWIRESRPVEGWVAFEITAGSYDQAVEKAQQRFQGTQNAWTLDVDREPVDARAA